MSYAAKILADSVSPAGHRLTTFEVTFPRIILAEFNTHRVFSRNSASSRAIPVKKMLARVQVDPFVPQVWGKNQKGMQASAAVLEGGARDQAEFTWRELRNHARNAAHRLAVPEEEGGLDVHKQIARDTFASWVADGAMGLTHSIDCGCDCHANNTTWPGPHCDGCKPGGDGVVRQT